MTRPARTAARTFYRHLAPRHRRETPETPVYDDPKRRQHRFASYARELIASNDDLEAERSYGGATDFAFTSAFYSDARQTWPERNAKHPARHLYHYFCR